MIIGTVKHDQRETRSFDYDMWDRVPEWKWNRIRQNSFSTRNSFQYKEASRRLRNYVDHRRGSKLTSCYTPKYGHINIRIPGIVKDIGLYLLRGLL